MFILTAYAAFAVALGAELINVNRIINGNYAMEASKYRFSWSATRQVKGLLPSAAGAIISLLVTLATLATVTYTPSARADTIIGDVLCYQRIADVPNIARFTFGYQSIEPAPVLLLPGPQNNFAPGPGSLGQITTFYPGYSERAFRLDFDFTVIDTYSWTLQSRQYLISLRSPLCPPQLAKPIATPQLLTGSNQTANVNAVFAAPLKVKVVSTITGAALPGIAVTFYAPSTLANASLSAATVMTDGSGVATVTATANAIRGAYTIYAVVSSPDYATPIVSAKFLLVNQ